MGKIKVPVSKMGIESIEADKIKFGTLHVQGVDRSFAYYIPKNFKKGSPLVIVCHGAYWNHEIMRRATGFDFEKLADEFGFAVAYPNSFSSYWFDGRITFNHPAKNLELNEGEFLRKISRYMTGVYGASSEELYYSGFSNGGMLGFKLAAEPSPIFKGMALWCCNLPDEETLNFKFNKSETPILLINCKGDKIVTFEGGELNSAGKSSGSINSCHDTFLKIAGIDDMPEGDECREYHSYKHEKNILIEVKGGGHTIPHTDTSWPPTLGEVARFNSIHMVWDYYKNIMDDKL